MTLMTMRTWLGLTLIISMLNGIFSPFTLFVFITYGVWYPWFLPQLPQAVYFAASLIVSTLTIMTSGIPAALYERYSGQESSGLAGLIWAAFAVLLTMPALPNMLRALS
jgi:hydrogenase/urease accessory protein HupE